MNIVYRWRAELLAVLALLLLLLSRYIKTEAGEVDDFAVLRAGAWLDICAPDADVSTGLRDHLAVNADKLAQPVRERFRLRADFGGNYLLTGPLVRLLEGSFSLSPSVAVRGACLLQHLLAITALFLIIFWRWATLPWVLAALLLTALATLWPWPRYLGTLVAFHKDNMSWTTAAPRGAAVVAWFAAVLASLGATRRRHLLAALGLLSFSLTCHRSMALLCFASSLPSFLLWHALRARARQPLPAWLLAAGFGVLAVAVAVLKLALLLHFHETVSLSLGLFGSDGATFSARELVRLSAWAGEIVVVLWLWQRARTAGMSTTLLSIGDTLALLVTITGAAALGLNAVNPPATGWYGPLFYLFEASHRIRPVPQLLVLALASLSCAALWPRALQRAVPFMAGLVVVLSLRAMLAPRSELPASVPVLARLLEQGASAYANETVYYTSVGNHVMANGCGQSARAPVNGHRSR